MLFEDHKISFDDINLFSQNVPEWNSVFLLKNELEVVGFYFSDHPLSSYPQMYFKQNNIWLGIVFPVLILRLCNNK